jgi:hypothetical protein
VCPSTGSHAGCRPTHAVNSRPPENQRFGEFGASTRGLSRTLRVKDRPQAGSLELEIFSGRQNRPRVVAESRFVSFGKAPRKEPFFERFSTLGWRQSIWTKPKFSEIADEGTCPTVLWGNRFIRAGASRLAQRRGILNRSDRSRAPVSNRASPQVPSWRFCRPICGKSSKALLSVLICSQLANIISTTR